MLQIPDRDLSVPAAAKLRDYQADIDNLDQYSARVREAKKRFKSRNRETNKTFREVRKTLRDMCGGVLRCMYCEDSLADQVEHFRPKALYPDAVFRWSNYLLICGLCNRLKSSRFLVLEPDSGQVLQISRRQSEPVTPPPNGRAALVSPRRENPLDLLQLDLIGTFRFLPRLDLSSVDQERAAKSIEILGLNRRDNLPRARRDQFQAYLALLHRYGEKMRADATPAALLRVKEAILSLPHPTVWAEIKRQKAHLPEIDDLFSEIPEALGW